MRTSVLALAAGAALALTGPAFAQMMMGGYPGPTSSMDGSQAAYQYNHERDLPAAYVKKLAALSDKILQMRAEDGGKLTPEHLDSLQHELVQLKRQYHVAADLRVRAG